MPAQSIALVSDAIHNLTDVPTLVISWLAIAMGAAPAHAGKNLRLSSRRNSGRVRNAMVLTLAALCLIDESVAPSAPSRRGACRG